MSLVGTQHSSNQTGVVKMSIAILHLTDIHMVADPSKNHIFRKTLQIVNACKYQLSSADELVIIVSGDIASAGSIDEYDNAFVFLDDIRQSLMEHLNKNVSLLIVPGNHDCDFSNDQTVRDYLISNLSESTMNLSLFSEMNKVQTNFFIFTKNFFEFDNASLCNKVEVTLGNKVFLFLLLNSAWMSQRHEKPGHLFMPINLLPNDIDVEKYDCIVSVMHHPYNWFHPDNASQLNNFFRQTTDLLILGHEHREDAVSQFGANWSIREYRGKELQNDTNDDSGFALYKFSDGLDSISVNNYSWNSPVYILNRIGPDLFSRNTFAIDLIIKPNPDFIMTYIEDPGIIINHPTAENVKLSDVFVWPDLEKYDYKDESTTYIEARIRKDIPQELLSNKYAVISGDSLVGKTALSKMLFLAFSRADYCCILIEGKALNTTSVAMLRSKLEAVFIKQYSADALDKFRGISPEKRTIIVDNFQDVPYRDNRLSKVFSQLDSFFSHVILLTDSEIETRMRVTKLPYSITSNITFYHVCNLGNAKRHELITKWYSLQNEFANTDINVITKINNTSEKVASLLGTTNGFIPALPIYILGILQNIDSALSTSFSGSEYGFLYDSLINKNLSTLKYNDSGQLNIDVNVLSALAFDLLKNEDSYFSADTLHRVSEMYSNKKRVPVQSDSILKKMVQARLIELIGDNTYRFRYPYVFYFFAGRYIAYNLSEVDVIEQVDYMCQRLYNEKYGNIIIFLCHFANSKEIIDRILSVASIALEKYDTFTFDKHPDIFGKASEIINQVVSRISVGTEDDVIDNRQKELERRDSVGMQDGTVRETEEISEEDAQKEQDIADLSAAMRTIDVLGQIIKNYPGDIDGEVKEQIINEIYSLGMRVTEALISTIGVLEEDFIQYLIERMKEKEHSPDPEDLKRNVHKVFVLMIANMTMSMIRKISLALYNPCLLEVVSDTFSKSQTVAKQLIIADLELNRLKHPDIEKTIKLNEELLKSRSTAFAESVLRTIVARYLRYNNCGVQVRNRLCAKFYLSNRMLYIENAKHDSNK